MQSVRLRRHLLGVASLMTIAGGLALLWSSDKGSMPYLTGTVAWRVGLTLAALWLALPQVLALTARLSPRIVTALCIAALIVVVRPRALPLVVLGLSAVVLLEMVAGLFRPLPPSRRR